MSNPLYYESDLEKKFNYFWSGGTWTDFTRLVNADTRPAVVREKFYTVHPVHKVRVPMSREAYFRWRRSLKHEQDRAKLKPKEGQANATKQ